MDRLRAMYPEAFKEAKQGEVSCLPEIYRRNRTEEDAVIMRMDPKLFKAAQEGDVKYLQEEILQRNRTEEDKVVVGMDPKLYKAAQQGNVKYLLEQILQRNRREEVGSQDRSSDEFFLRRTRHGNNNILHIAARAGHDKFAKKAHSYFPFLSDQVNSQGDTPLLVAARFGHLQVLETLLVAAAKSRTNSSQRDVEEGLVVRQLVVLLINSEQGTTALHEALRNGHEHVARFLLGLKPEMATLDSRAGESPLFLAAESHCQELVVNILRSGWAYSTKGPDGKNALHATRNCDDKIISQLITQKPDLMRQLDYRGKAAIHYAVEADQYRVLLHRMLEADASIALFPDVDGYTPLLRATSRGNLKICRDLLQKCPESVEARNSRGQNALHLFKLHKERDGEELFKIPKIRKLLDIGDGDDDGNTPLHLALMEHHYDKALIFIARPDIDLGAVNRKGLTALDLCHSK